MEPNFLVQTLASVVAASAPVVLAAIGETISEKSGVINLSLDGSIALSAMTGFAVAFLSGSVALGMLAGMAVGALVALVVAFASITLRQQQVAVGFVLTLLCADLADFLGNPFVRKPGPSVPHAPIPYLSTIPVLGPILFDHNMVVYVSMLSTVVAWWYIYRTQAGLKLQGVGERPESAFARGECQPPALYLHRGRRRAGGVGRRVLLAEHQAGLEPPAHLRHRLDCAGDRHFRRLEPLAGGGGVLSVWTTQSAGQHPAAESGLRQRADASFLLRSVCLDDLCPAAGEQRRGGPAAGAPAHAPGPHDRPDHPRTLAGRVGEAVCAGMRRGTWNVKRET